MEEQKSQLEKPTELKPRQKFFALVYQMREAQKAYFKTTMELSKELKKNEPDAVKIAELKAAKAKQLSNSKGIEALVDNVITDAEEYYTKKNLIIYWK